MENMKNPSKPGIHKATERGSLLPETFVKEIDNVSPYPDQIREQSQSQVHKVLYSEWIGIRPYKIIDAPAQIKLDWKREIDKIIDQLKEGDPQVLVFLGVRRNEFMGDRYIDVATIQDILDTPDFDHEQLAMLAIALYMFKHKAKYKFINGHFKAILGSQYHLENFIGQERDANCVDIACLTRELALLYGIDGTILHGEYDHRYFVADSGRVLDIMGGWKVGGVFNSEEEYLKYINQREDA